MEFITTHIGTVGGWLGVCGVWLLCLAGLILSSISMSGTWAVVAASALSAWVLKTPSIGIWTVVIFALIAGAVEALEAFAGVMGVKRRGGSNMAGCAAMIGGILGLFVGGLIPIPIVGSLIGMMLGSFVLAYAVEHARLKHSGDAARIARGVVWAKLFVIFLKVCVTLGMSGFLLFRLHFV